MILHLGVIDVPYSTAVPQSARRVAARTKRGGGATKPQKFSASPAGGKTTGDVAEILEAKYHVMESFAFLHEKDIAGALEETISDAFDNVLLGAPIQPGGNALAAATGDIETMFHKFISNREMDGVQPGVPTKAAQRGVSHRFKNPNAKRAPRPSFRDRGLYDSSFKTWLDT